MSFIQILLQCAVLLFLLSKVKHTPLRVFLSFITSFLCLAQLAAFLITGTIINYRVLNNFNIDAIHGFGENYSFHFFLFVLLLIPTTFLFNYISKKIAQYPVAHRSKYTIPLMLIFIGVLTLPKGIISELYKVYKISHSEEITFHQSLSRLGIPPKQYVEPENLEATSGKNIIVISMESIERGYLDDIFKELTPNLRKLSKTWTYYSDLPEAPGGNWTIASLYNYQVGMPAFFHSKPTEYFQGISNSKLTGLGHVLDKAGYNSRFIISDANFAGTKDLMQSYKIPVISVENTIGSYKKNWWGISDFDIFAESKLQLEKLTSNSKKPFALFISTINSHGPNGLADIRMDSFVKKRETRLEQTVSFADYLIHDFIQYLKSKQLLSKTSIYIFPDHLLISEPNKVLSLLSKKKRSLFLITNEPEHKFTKTTNQTLYQLEIPRVIIDGAEIETNAKFLTDYVKEKNIIDFVQRNIFRLVSLNNSSISRTNFSNGISVSKVGNKLNISSESQTSQVDVSKNNHTVSIAFSKDLILLNTKVFNGKRAPLRHKYDRKYDHIYLTVKIIDEKIQKVFFGNKDSKRIKLKETNNGIFFISKENIQTVLTAEQTIDKAFKRSFYIIRDIINVFTNGIKTILTKKVNDILRWFHYLHFTIDDFSSDKMRFIAHAGGQIDGHIYTNSLEAINESYKNGLRMFELDIYKTSDHHFVAVHGWKNWLNKVDYSGPTPPSLETFLQYKIYDKYTPMDMKLINKWFKEHPDAILVTDKVNLPKEFSELFVDKKRLMMELFTWEAVKEAISAEIKAPVPNFRLIKRLKKSKRIKHLKSLGIKHIASSRNEHKKHLSLIKMLNKNDIKLFAYGFYAPNLNEYYLACHERELYFGAYVDNWNLNEKINCQSKKFNGPPQIN